MPDDRFLHRRAGHSEKVNLLTDLEYRVWTQYLLSADDFGVMRLSALTIQADNDHLANRPAKAIQRCLDALVRPDGLLRTFDHQGRRYAFQADWQTWQKVAYPRTTNNPKPPDVALATCDEPTQKLFAIHPGGAGRTRKNGSENVPETVSECSPLMRAGAPAKRLTANGRRLPASGERPTADGPQPMDAWFRELQAQYPAHRVTRSARTEHAFVGALLGASDGPVKGWALMCANLSANLASHEWRVKGMVPSLEKYLTDGLWLNVLPAAPTSMLVNDTTARTLTSAAQFAKGGTDGTH